MNHLNSKDFLIKLMLEIGYLQASTVCHLTCITQSKFTFAIECPQSFFCAIITLVTCMAETSNLHLTCVPVTIHI